MNHMIKGYDVAGRLVLLIRQTSSGPRLLLPEVKSVNIGVARLVLPSPKSNIEDADRELVLDLLPGPPRVADGINQVKVTTSAGPGDARLVNSVQFKGAIRVYLGIDGDLHVHGSLARQDGVLVWKWLYFHTTNESTSAVKEPFFPGFDVTKSLVGQPPRKLPSTRIMPLWTAVGLRHLTSSLPSPIELEIVPAPQTAPLRYTGENLDSQLTAAPPDSGPLVLRLTQACRLDSVVSSQAVAVEPLRIDLPSAVIRRAGLNRSGERWGVRCVQTHNVLDPDGSLDARYSNWIWRMLGLPVVPLLQAYNDAAHRYLSSLQTIQDGRPISGVPLFEARPWDAPPTLFFPPRVDSEVEYTRRWCVALDVRDSLAETVPLNAETLRQPGNVSFRAAFPIDGTPSDDAKKFKHRCWLPALACHDFYRVPQFDVSSTPGVVTLDCVLETDPDLQPYSWDPKLTDEENRIRNGRRHAIAESVWRGFVFRLRRWFRKGELVPTAGSDSLRPIQSVRVGALDLGFPPPLDAIPKKHYNQNSAEESGGVPTDRGEADNDSLPQRQTSYIALGWRNARGSWSGDLPSVALEWLFRLSAVLPGSQDGLPSEEFTPVDSSDDANRDAADDSPSAVSRRFRREPSLLIAADGAQSRGSSPFLLRLREYTAPGQSQALSLNLFEWGTREQSHVRRDNMRLVVVDRQPFMVALVAAPPLVGIGGADGNLEIGNWSAAGFEGASWELAGATEGFTLHFPPQSVGESMEKIAGKDALDDQPAQFRLSPVSTFELESSYFRQNFTEAAWNLRRILGYPGQRAPGAGVRRLEFELLYGMTCEVKADALRLAELSARLGAVPAALPQQLSRVLGKDRYGNELDDLSSRQAVFRRLNYEWSRQYRTYLSRLGIFEPWLRFNEAQLNLQTGVQYTLRPPDRIMQDPTAPEEPNADGTQRRLLAGGALWGFDFVSQYQPFKELPEKRRSTSGELNRPAFSALGGWGHQKAVFQFGLTTIYSDTSMGRAFFYSVERRGRIAGYWNFAKHVVIYERTVSTALQFRPVRDTGGTITGPTQDHLAGRPVLRKVREFIEILQPRRTYPDLGGGAIARGCVESIEFARTTIPVDYRWGRDVKDGQGKPVGYVIPLWRPDADPVVYPKPQIAIRLAGAAASGETFACEITDPQKLQFYSESDNTTGEEVNTDKWNAVRGVDYPDADWPRAAPVTAPANGNLEQSLPDEVTVAAGYDAFTYHIQAAKPVNVVANRTDQATAAMIRNVSMVRADPITDLPRSDDAKAATAVVAAQNGIHAARNLMAELLELAQGNLTDGAVRDGIKRQAAALLSAVVTGTSSIDGQLQTVFDKNDKLLSTPRDWEALTKDAIARWVKSADAAVKSEFKSRLLDQVAALSEDATEAKSRVQKLLHESWDVFRLAAPPIDPGIGQLRVRCDQAVEQIVAAPRTLEAIVAETIAATKKLFDCPSLDIVPSVGQMQALSDLAKALQTRFVGALRQAVEKAIDGLGPFTRRNLLDPARAMIAVADEELTAWRRNLLSDLNRPVDEILELLFERNVWLKKFATTLDGTLTEVRGAIADLKAVLNELYARTVKNAGAALVSLGDLVQSNALLEKCLQDVLDPLTTKTAQIRNHVQQLVDKVATGVEVLKNPTVAVPDLKTFFDKFTDPTFPSSASPLMDKLLAPIKDVADLSKEIKKAVAGISAADIDAIFAGGANDLDKVRRELQDAFGSVKARVGGLVDGLTQSLEGRFVEGVVQKSGNVLRMVRAFGDAPLVQGMEFTRKQLGYFYDPLKALKGEAIDFTPAVALVNRVGGHLKALGVSLPTGKLLDQILPPPDDLLKQLDFGKLLPDFAGMKLDKLLPELKAPDGLKDKVKVTQSFDKQTGRGWVQADVRVPVDGPSTLFDAGALKVSLRDVLLTAQVRIEAGVSGTPSQRQSGKLVGTWDLTLGGSPLISFEETQLSFDESGKTHFSLDPTKVRMNGVLSMLSDVLKSFSTDGSGFKLRLKEENGMPVGVEALLDLLLPDLAFGACALTNLRFRVCFELVALPEFAIGLQVSICQKTAPFTLTVFVLGGGGWFVARGRYLPLTNRLTTAVSIGLSAGAALAIAFGPVKGCVFAFFYVEGELQTDSDNPGGRQLIIRIGLLLGGDVDVCGLITVSIRLLLEMEYDGEALTGRGMLSIRIKVCFFLTISVSQTVEKKLAGGGKRTAKGAAERQARVQQACDKHLARTAA